MNSRRAEGWENEVWDAVVVGAGPGGAMVAYELGRAGKSVLLLDRQAFPRWKVCGGTLSPGVQHLLAEAGLAGFLDRVGARPLRALRLGGWALRAELPLDGTSVLSRLALDGAMVRAAEEAGAVFLSGARARLGGLSRGLRGLDVSLEGKRAEISTRVVVAADGLASGLMAEAGVPSRIIRSGRRSLVGMGAVFPRSTGGYPSDIIHMALAEEGYAGLVRTEDGYLNVAAALNPHAVKKVGSAPGVVQAILRGAGWPPLPEEPVHGWRGTPELTRRPSCLGAERLFAVGDAGGYVEPFTGEGMFWALAGARALAPLVARASERWHASFLTHWANAHHRLIGRAQRLCRATAWTLARPTLSRAALRLMSYNPRVAGPIVRRVGSPLVPSI